MKVAQKSNSGFFRIRPYFTIDLFEQ